MTVNAANIDGEIKHAFELAQDVPGLHVTEPLYVPRDASADAEFRCTLPVDPQPNRECLPPVAHLRVRIDARFPMVDVQIFSESPEIRGFPHQDAETGKLCLFRDRSAPWNARRLRLNLEWAKEWLADAAQGQLLAPGDPYELPDFSRRGLGAEAIPIKLPLLFDESSITYGHWSSRLGRSGDVELHVGRLIQGILVKHFRDADGIIRTWNYAKGLTEEAMIYGRWVLLPRITVTRHRPVQTIGELVSLCKESKLHLLNLLKDAWQERNKVVNASVLLVGFPIPSVVGGPNVEVHWQPLWFRNWRNDLSNVRPRYSRIKSGTVWNQLQNEGAFRPEKSLPWGKSENISRERMYARGKHTAIAALEKVAIAGCGALGATVAEMLARGGVPQMDLYDLDFYAVGNQCRHTLDGSAIGRNKAYAMAERLVSTNPLSNIVGHSFRFPLVQYECSEAEAATHKLEEAKLIIDCTTDHGAFIWMSQLARLSRARMASMFLNFNATVLTLCISGRHTSCKKVYRRLCDEVAAGRTPVKLDEHSGNHTGSDLVIPGAGCWHPTFPAVNSSIWALAAAGVSQLESIVGEKMGTDGVGVLIRRHESLKAGTVQPLIEVVWSRLYR